MEITLSFREADNLFSSLFADGNGSERKKQAAYLMVGGKGFGKSELLNRISRRLEQSNFRVHRVRSYGINGGLKFHAFNEVINQILGEIEERPMGKIVDFFQRYQFDNGGMTCIIVDAIERMEQESRNLFLFLSRLAQRKNFVLIGALTENGNNREEQVFLDIATSEEDLEIIRLKKPSYDDIKYYLEESGYLVPEHFSKELYRLINGNFQLLAYCLRYYEEQGIINSNKQLEEVSYRFFPIPPNLEVHYSRLLTSLPTEQRQILEILALVGEELEPGFISKLTGFKLGDVVRSLEDLRDRGFIVENNMNFAVVNATVADIVTKSISRESIVMEESFTTSDAFIALSVLTRLRVYTKLRDRKSIEALINENWEDLYDNIANLSVSSSFFFDIQRNMESEEAKNKVSILIAALLINEGQLEQAMNLLQDPRLEKVYQ
ncbi:MAG TPA: hypothetical protein VKU79_01500, partial [Thermoplasmataceae archaeon]|nr:hypothetical protein [Thermoplasmataceae archaeon]